MYEARLINLNRIMHRVPWQERKGLILKLNACKETHDPNGESLVYKKERLTYEIYSAVQKKPFMFPEYSCFVKKEDVENLNFWGQIMRGINGYLQAPIEKQRAFQRNLLNPWMPSNIVARWAIRSNNLF